MNKADSRRLSELFLSQECKLTNDKNKADIIIYNTCSVRAHAENKAMSHLGRLKFLKKKNPKLKICVAGCMAQRMGKKIISSLPHVDLVVGPSTMFKIPLMLDEGYTGVYPDTPETLKEFSKYIYDIPYNRMEYNGYVPIMKGCNNFCTYCIVPYVRGREQYREKQEVLDECRALAHKGLKEIMLLGQTVNSHPEFKEILKETAGIEGVERVRFVTSYPGKMDKEIVDIVAENPVLCNYFHIPIQSGSDTVLKKMNRKYTIEDFLDVALYIREKIPEASISSDFIVGFPGETEEDFKKTLEVVEKAEFDQCFTFKYSPRPLTSAAKMKDDVAEKVKKERLARLNELCNEKAHKRNKLLMGKTFEVFSEGKNSGRTDTYKIVYWEGEKAGSGEKVNVKVTEALPHSLKGERV